jgi:hypothetical protein
MTDHLKISIVTPNRNGAKFLERTIRSVLDQGYPNLEYIVIDGASDDDSMAIIDRYRDQLSLVISERDSGHTDAINKGLTATSGDVMGWINSDDVLLPGALNAIDEVFREFPDVEWITGRPTMMTERDIVHVHGGLRYWSWLRFFGGDYRHIQQESTFWRRAVWEKAGAGLDKSYPLASDLELWTRFFAHARLHSVDVLLGAFRSRSGQLSISQAEQYEAECAAALAAFRDRIKNDSIEPYRPALERASNVPAAEMRGTPLLAALDNPQITYDFRQKSFTRKHLPPHPLPAQVPVKDDIRHFALKHRGERCFVMGNGPSLNKTDLSLLDDDVVFACNGAFLLFNRIKWRPKYYTCVDVRVIRDRAADITAMLNENPEMVAFFPAEIGLHDGTGRRFDTRMIIPPAPNRYYFNEVRNSPKDAPGGMFSLNCNRAVVQPFTVAITMLQLAAYMGFNPIYLIGCDTSYVVPASAKQEGPKVGNQGLLITSTADDDPNHFDPTYFGKGREWHNPQVDGMINHHRWAKMALDPIGVEVINATVGGQLEVYPRAAFDTSLFTKYAS